MTGNTRPVNSVVIAPDGTWLATGSRDKTVRIWDPATGQQRARLTGHTGPVNSVVIAPDSTWLATGSRDGTVRIWDPATGQQRARLTGHTGPVESVVIAPDSTWLATGSRDGTVRIWDPATCGISAAMRVDSPLPELVWSPSGETLAAVGDAGLYCFSFKSGFTLGNHIFAQ